MNVSPTVATFITFGLGISLLILGLPLAFALGSAGAIVAVLLWGPGSLMVVYTSLIGNALEFVLVAVPLFVFMGVAMERSGVAEDLYDTMYKWMGGLRGGLAAGTVGIATVMAAMTGISGAACVAMGLIALPSMLQRRYDAKLAMGSIMAGGALGILIPPSVLMIVLGLFANVSIGKLFAGGVFTGLLLSSLFIIYILIRSWWRPAEAPALPEEHRVGWAEKFLSIRGIILPALIIIAVLGAIFSGIATPTEAAAVGAVGTIISAMIRRRFNWEYVKESAFRSSRITVMALWLIFGAGAFTAVYTAVGGPELVKEFLAAIELNRWVVFVLMQLSFFILGCLIDPIGIIMITIPVYLPVLELLQFDILWYLIIFCVNMEMAYLTPPFGFNLFYMKSVAPQDTGLVDIYKSSIPFVILQAIGLVIIAIFPPIAVWLPNLLFAVTH